MKALVLHQGKRDDYQVANALAEAGHEVLLVTSGYSTEWLERLARFIPWRPLQKLAERRSKFLIGRQIKSLLAAELVARAAQIVVGEGRAQEWLTRRLASTALRALRAGTFDICICYSYHAFQVLSSVRGGSCRTVLFQCHPHPNLVLDTFLKLQAKGYMPAELKEKELSYSPEYLAMLMAEAQVAEKVLCASSFTKKSLIYAGCSSEKITVIPYGVPQARRVEAARGDAKTRLLFVGQFSYRKGLTVLAEVLNRIDFEVELVFIGRGYREVDPSVIVSNPRVTVTVLWDVPWRVLEAEYARAHVFFFPSFIEGFAQVIIEAMSFGCIPVTSENTCGPDVIVDGEEGFILRYDDVDGYVQILGHLRDPAVRSRISAAAKLKASSFTWERFRRTLLQELTIGS